MQQFPGIAVKHGNIPLKPDPKSDSLLDGIRQQAEEYLEIQFRLLGQSLEPGDLVWDGMGRKQGDPDFFSHGF